MTEAAAAVVTAVAVTRATITTAMDSAKKFFLTGLIFKEQHPPPPKHLIFSFKDKYTTEIKFPPKEKQVIRKWKPLPDYFYDEEKKVPSDEKVEEDKRDTSLLALNPFAYMDVDDYSKYNDRDGMNFTSLDTMMMMKFSCQCSLVGFENTKRTIIRDQYDYDKGCYNIANLKAEFKMAKGQSVYIEVAQIYRDEPSWEKPYSHHRGFSFYPMIRTYMTHNNWKNIERCSKPIHGLLQVDVFNGKFSHPAMSIDLYEGKLDILNILASKVIRWA